MRYIESRAPPAREYSDDRVSLSISSTLALADTLVADFTTSTTTSKTHLTLQSTMRLSYALSLAGVLAPVMCDVPSTTIGIAELISVHLRRLLLLPQRNPGAHGNPIHFRSRPKYLRPESCLSSGPLSIVQSESTLAAPRGVSRRVLESTDNAGPWGGVRALTGHSTILFLNRGFAGAQAAGALLP